MASTRKIQTSGCFEQNHSPISCNELPPRIHQKLKQTDPTPFGFIAQESGRVPRWCWIVKMALTRKIQTSGCFEQNHSLIPCNELPPTRSQTFNKAFKYHSDSWLRTVEGLGFRVGSSKMQRQHHANFIWFLPNVSEHDATSEAYKLTFLQRG
jgi:hypothetical protein